MVDVSSQNNSVSINVSSGGNSASIKATPDMAQYYSEKSREWAISNRIVENIDYSSKYYAEKSKESEAKAENYERSVIEKYNSFVEVSNQAEAELQTLKDDSISQINTVTSSGISDIANKTSEAVTEINSNKETATNEINNAKNSAVTQLSKEAQEQLKNIESTGFYMRDDKLYFINSEGEEEEFKSGGAGAVMFDTKIADHILQGEEALGWALQGTYVTKESYPDFYNKCLEQKLSAVETQVTLGESILTMFVNSNGHQFYNISDKSIVDAFYEAHGIADFYGIDEENERVFLPRNKYFAVTGVASVAGNGMTLGLTNGTTNFGLVIDGTGANGNTGALRASQGSYGSILGRNSAGGNGPTSYTYGITTDPTKSGIEAQLTPNENKYLYYCVGNTEVTQAITNVTEVTTSENDTIPLFTGMYFDFKPNNVSWLKAGEQQNSAGIYKTCYDTLVEIVNGVNNYDLKVINEADMVSGVDYSEYWILDQDNLTFRAPLTIATKSLSGGVAGNGMTLGLTDGTNTFGIYNDNSNGIVRNSSIYNTEISTANGTNTALTNNASIGVTTDPTKSGIIAEQSNAQLYFKVANAVQNLELLNAGEVLEGLANKLDIGHKQEIISWGMPDYSAGVQIASILKTSPYSYTAPCNGVIRFYSKGDHTWSIRTDNSSSDPITNLVTMNFSSGDYATSFLPVASGMTIYNAGAKDGDSAIFYPLKGAN